MTLTNSDSTRRRSARELTAARADGARDRHGEREAVMLLIAAKARRRFVAVIAAVGAAIMAAEVGGARAATVTFRTTDTEQSFRVPSGVEELYVVAVGARGYSAVGGFGAVVGAVIPARAGEVLYVEVGGNGSEPFTYDGGGGFNGGGNSHNLAGGGGGASDVRTAPASSPGSLASRLIVAGGGGGGGMDGSTIGSAFTAGGDAGAPGVGVPVSGGLGGGGGVGGGAATLTMGGASGDSVRASAGTLGQGGDSGGLGGGGGGGLYGGGGGGTGIPTYSPSGGGGGGSSGVGASALHPWVGADASGVPSVTITYNSNAFRISRATVNAPGTIALPITVAAAGRIKAVGTATVPAGYHGRGIGARITYGASTVSVTGAGTVKLEIAPSRAAARLLRAGATLHVALAVAFSPNGASTNRKTIHITVKQKTHRRHG